MKPFISQYCWLLWSDLTRSKEVPFTPESADEWEIEKKRLLLLALDRYADYLTKTKQK